MDNVANELNASRGIHITPGSGIVAHLGQFMAYAEGDDDGLNQLVVRLNALAGAPWSEVVRTLTSDIAAAGYDNHPAMACAAIEDDRIGVLVFGDLSLSVTTDVERRTLDGRHSSTWIDLAVPGSTARVRCGEQSPSTVVGVLRDGVVSGGGFVFDLHGPIPAATRWDADETAEPAAEAPAPEAPIVAEVADEPTDADEPAADAVATADAEAEATDVEQVETDSEIAEAVAEAPEVDEAQETEADVEADDVPVSAESDADDEPEDVVDTETLNGSIFGVPLQDESEGGANGDASDALLADTSLDDAANAPSLGAEAADSGNDFPAVSGIFSRSESNDIEDAEVVVESDPAPRSADEVFATVGVDEPTETGDAELGVPVTEEELPPPPVPGPNGLEPAPQGSVAVATVPELRGVLCPNGHLTSIQDSHCRTCGLPIDPTGDIVVGSRPSLGTLTFDDGAQLQLTRPVVIGRGVPERYAIDAEPATTVLLDDVQGTISRVHLEVHLNGWDVEIIDMNSSSGTFTRSGDERARLRAEDPTAILPGTIVEVGQRSFTFSAGPLPAE